jgi:protocatechuate 3,4-dioxygenase beta subunit
MSHFLLAGFLSASVLAAQSRPDAGSMEGRVLNSLTGAPVRRATVTLTAPEIWLTAYTDVQGTFQFTALPPGTYRLSASRSGFLDRRVRRPIPLGPSDQVKGAEIRLQPQSVLAGHVVDENGEPVDRAMVWIFKQTYRDGKKLWDRVNSASETNDRGEYRFPNLKPGRYLLHARDQRPAIHNRYDDPPKEFYVPAYYPNASSQEQATPVEVGAGAEVQGVDIHLFKLARPPSFHVRGKVTGVPPDSQIVVFVGLVPSDGGFFGGGSTSARPPDYAFDLETAAGEYLIAGNVYSGGPEAYGSGSVVVTADVAGVVLAMKPAPELTGRISLAESGVKVKLETARAVLTRLSYFRTPISISDRSELRPDAAGRFVSPKPLAPGRYRLDVNSIPDSCYVREIKFGGQEISPDDFEILSSGQLEIVLSNTAAKIAGSVTDADGKLFPGSTVTLVPADGSSSPVKQTTGDAGNFRFPSLRPGTYKLFAWEDVDDDLWQDPGFRKRYESRGTEIVVVPGQTQNVQLHVIAAEDIN